MTTTVKISTELRDRLKQQAAAAHRTLGEQVEYLVSLSERQQRFADLKNEIAQTPADLMQSYRDEVAQWETVDK